MTLTFYGAGGGFPNSVLASSDELSVKWRRDFIRTYLERDIPQLGPRIPAETLKRFWTMLAHCQGCLLNAARLAGSLGVDGKTVAKYLDLLVDLLLVRRLMPWQSNVGKRLVKSPKVYVRDSGIAHALLNIENKEALQGHPIVGSSWEGFIIENILSVVPDGTQAWFYRTSAGSETDLILSLPGKGLWSIEIKRTLSPGLSKGFRIASDDVNAEKRFIVYAGDKRYPLSDDTEAISLLDLVKEINHEN